MGGGSARPHANAKEPEKTAIELPELYFTLALEIFLGISFEFRFFVVVVVGLSHSSAPSPLTNAAIAAPQAHTHTQWLGYVRSAFNSNKYSEHYSA